MLLRLMAILGLCCIHRTTSIWWSIVEAARGPGGTAPCKNYRGAGVRQEQFCKEQPELMDLIRKGAEEALQECARLFQHDQWNCDRETALGPLANKANKETGFLHAITTAGAMHAVVRGCSLGLLKDCQCDDGSDDGGDGGEEASLSSPPPPPSLPSSAHEDTNRTSTTPTTTRCSANVSYARRIAEMFINADEDLRNANGHISRHNNRAGREVFESMVERPCKCFGYSGSCSLKTCWKRAPDMRKVGERLRVRYDEARRVQMPSPDSHMKLKDKKTGKEPKTDDIVYLRASPNYCTENKNLAIKGVANRECNPNASNPGNCHQLCCGHGVEEKKVVKEQCKCKFVWCCGVQCTQCTETRHYCKAKRRGKSKKIRRT
ncbi:protein Wnt-2b-A-like [Oscarella lobularis]|uniref:protein Wnt-2b-A-like n=1 Tax=Oscarella lobularis TaxID=121494 RepID=UPI0033134873